jgi:hypothetical protein
MSTLKRTWIYFDQHSNQLALLIFFVSLLIYVLTLAPGLLWGGGDFSTFQTKVYTGQIESSVFGHPLWVILARPFLWLPVRDVAYRANLASAFFAAAALAFVFLAARLLTRHSAASLLATNALLVSHTFWTYAVLPKPYSLNALLLSACLFLVLRWRESQRGRYLYLAAVLYGLGPLNHLVMLTTSAGFAAFLIWSAWQQRTLRRQTLIGMVFLLIGLLPFLWLEFRPDPSANATQSIGPFVLGLLSSLTVPSRLLIGLAVGLGLFVYQFFLLVPFSAIGLWQSWKRDCPAAALLSLAALGNVAFLLGATDPRTGGDYVWNLHYYLMLYVVSALWLAYGLVAVWQSLTQSNVRRAILIGVVLGVPVLAYALAPVIARPLASNVPGFRQIGGRDNLIYVLSPWKHTETAARPFAESVLNTLPAHSLLFADYGIWSMVNYLQVVENVRPDVRLFQLPAADQERQLPLLLEYQGTGELYLADTNRYYDTDLIRSRFDLIPAGPIYRLILKHD